MLATVLIVLQGLTFRAADVISWAGLLLAVLCFIWQVSWILPYTNLWRKEVGNAADAQTSGAEISILTANVLMHNRNVEGLLALVRKYEPDILVTLETDAWWQTHLDELEVDMPHTVKCPLDNLYGMHVYSRLPFDAAEIAYLVEEDVPSIHLATTLDNSDAAVQIHFLHPAPPSPTENTCSTQRDAELIVVAETLCDSSKPTIVAGDLNDVAWSYTTRLFRKISGLLDPRVGRGMFNTFHAQYWFMRWPLDHLFHSDHFSVQEIRRLPANGSDHFALLARLVYTPADDTNEAPLNADSEDHQAAGNIVAGNTKDNAVAEVAQKVGL
ncbi:MAG: endonuclease/exonuclease/phosphatase family protein [bacterium]